MKKLKIISIITFFSFSMAMSTSIAAQTTVENTEHVEGASKRATDMTNGEVRKVDKDTGKVTLRHDRIENLDMPGMTMVFHVQDKSMLDDIHVGDKVRFKAKNIDGKLTVTDIKVYQ